MKVIIANNNNNNKNSNNSTSCVGYLQSSEGGESGVLSPAGAGLCKNCLSASGQFKTKIKTKQNKKHIYILVYSWGGTVQKGEHHHYPQNGYCVCMHLLVVNSLNRTYAIYNECRQQLYFS